MKKILVACITTCLAVATFIVAEDTQTTSASEETNEDVYIFAIPAAADEIHQKMVGTGMSREEEDGYYMTGYLDGSIKHLKVHEGEIEILTTYETNYAPDRVYDEVTDDAGNRYVACFAHNGENNDIGTIKFNPDGEMDWVRIFDSGGRDISWKIGVDDDGNVYAEGFMLNERHDWDVRTIKYSPEGEIVWNQVYDSGDYDRPAGVYVDDDGYVCVKVSPKHSSGYDDEAPVIKYSADGELQE